MAYYGDIYDPTNPYDANGNVPAQQPSSFVPGQTGTKTGSVLDTDNPNPRNPNADARHLSALAQLARSGGASAPPPPTLPVPNAGDEAPNQLFQEQSAAYDANKPKGGVGASAGDISSLLSLLA